jgi:uncharacterized protein (TIGR00369 family)
LKAPNPEFSKRIEQYLKRQHFMKLIGFELTEIEEGRTRGELLLSNDHQQQTGLVHGGVTATIADIVSGFAAYTVVLSSHHVVTVELRVSYLRPGIGTKLVAEGTVLKYGKKLVFCESQVWVVEESKEELIAKASAVMSIVLPEKA